MATLAAGPLSLSLTGSTASARALRVLTAGALSLAITAPVATARTARALTAGASACALTAPSATPVSADLPTPSDTPSTIRTPLYWVAIEPSEDLGAVLQGGQVPHRDRSTYYGGYKPPLIRSISAITRSVSDYLTGSLPAQTASVLWDDTRRFVRNVFGTARPDLTSSPIWIYLISQTQRLLQGVPRLLFYGFLSDDPLSSDLGYTTNANDLVGKDYSLLGDEVLIPKRTYSTDAFPGLPRGTEEFGVPIIGGTVSNAAIAADAGYGAIRLIDLGDFACQDGVTRRALGVAGHACKSITPYQNGSIPGGDYGVTIWAPGQAGWTDIVPSNLPYLELNGETFACVFVSGKRAAVYDDATGAVTIATVVSAASTVQFTVGVGEGAQFAATETIDIRRAANANATETRIVSSVVGDVITVGEALGAAPAAGDTARAVMIAADPWVYADVEGATPDNADGTGTLEENLVLLDRWLLEQWILGDYRGGVWQSSPSFEFYPGGAVINLIDRGSWDTAATVAQTLLPGGFVGGFVVGAGGKRQSTRTVMADAARSANLWRAWRGSTNQLTVAMIDRRRTEFLGGRSTLTDRREILSTPRFAATQLKEWLCNDLTYRYAQNYRNDGRGDWNFSSSHGNAPSRLQYGMKAKTDLYPFVRDRDTADTVAQQRIDVFSTLRQAWTFGEPLNGLMHDVLDGVPVTHYNGRGPAGFVDQALFVIKQTHEPRNAHLTYVGIDVDDLLAEAPPDTIPAGSLLFAPYNPDDYPSFVSNEGVYLGTPPNDPLFDTDGFGTVTQGVIQLDNGRLCVTNLGNYQNGVFNADMTLRATDPSDDPSSIAGGYDNGFFYGIRKDYPFNGNKLITKISSDTSLTVATYNTAETVQDVFALAVARDESYAYYAMTAGVRPGDVIRLDLSTLAKTIFVTAAGRLTSFNGMFTLRDGTLMVAWNDGTIIHYDTGGSVLHTYTRSAIVAITPGLTDTSFWVRYNVSNDSAREIEVATGSVLHDFVLPTGAPPAAHAGNASSLNWGQTFCVVTVGIP